MTREEAESELMQLYGSLSEEKKQALDVLMAQADGEYISKSKMLMFLNDMRFGIAPDETVADDDERREREAQVDVLDDLMEVVEQMPTVDIPQDHDGCKDCKYETYPDYYYPCCSCKQNYTDMWQKKPYEPTCDTCQYNTAAFNPCNACKDKSEYKPQERSDKE